MTPQNTLQHNPYSALRDALSDARELGPGASRVLDGVFWGARPVPHRAPVVPLRRRED